MDAIAIAVEILDGIGGKDNVDSLTYCATRLRFVLKDYDKVDDAKVCEAEEVKDTFHTRGQYQVVIGTGTVKDVYDQLVVLMATGSSYYTKDKAMAMTILEGIGGQDNLVSLAYCATRLRLELNDYDQVDDARVRQVEAVRETFHTRGQYQIVVGNEQVKRLYDEMAALVKQPVSGEKREYGPLTRVAKTLLGKG